MKELAAPKRRINSKFARFRLRIGHSRMHRYGVFALEDIPARREVIEYTGKHLNLEQAARIRTPEDIYLAWIKSELYVDGRWGGSGAQFINHSCAPNLATRRIGRHLYFFSRQKIRAGEELTCDYHYPIKLKRVPCRCGAPQCRGTVRYLLS
ncbi:MAG: SET domain-containing protein-lysine N-methyltransferase [Candidatus Acidiferrales bacterium]|jgi:SET domain-containing protein